VSPPKPQAQQLDQFSTLYPSPPPRVQQDQLQRDAQGRPVVGSQPTGNAGPVPLEVSPNYNQAAPINPARGSQHNAQVEQLNHGMQGRTSQINQIEMVSPRAPPAVLSTEVSPPYPIQQHQYNQNAAGTQFANPTSQNVTFQVSPSPSRKPEAAPR